MNPCPREELEGRRGGGGGGRSHSIIWHKFKKKTESEVETVERIQWSNLDVCVRFTLDKRSEPALGPNH